MQKEMVWKRIGPKAQTLASLLEQAQLLASEVAELRKYREECQEYKEQLVEYKGLTQ